MTEPALRPRPRQIDPARWSLRTRVGMAAAAGLLLTASFPPVDAGWSAPVAVAALLLALHGAKGRRALGLGAVFGVAFMGPLIAWLWVSAGVLAWFALTGLQAAWFAGTGWACARAARGRAAVVAVPLAWAAFEIGRSRAPMGGFTWGHAGLSQVASPLNGYAPYGGVHLVGVMVVALGALLAAAVVDRTRLRRAVAAAVAIVVAGMLLPSGAGPVAGELDVAAVQGNVPRTRFVIGRDREGPEDEIIVRNHIAATEDLAGGRPPGLVIWPENSFDRDPRDYPDLFQPTQDLIRRVGAPFLIGAILDTGTGFTNTNLHLGADGQIIGRYDKVHLVPFGEYVPAKIFRRLVPILDEEIPRDGEPGTELVVFPIGGARVGSVICFESAYPALVRRFVAAGADLLVVTTNNASFGDSPAAAQHLAQSRMRAIENGRSVAHTAIAGISALIRPDGSVIEQAPLFTRQVLRETLPLHRGLTPYARWGHVIETVLLVGGLLAALRRVRA